MQAWASTPLKQPTGCQYDCICIKYRLKQLHKVSHTAWNQHLASMGSEEEHQHIHTARLFGDHMASLPPLTAASSPFDHGYSAPPSVHRAEACRGLAKWARENQDLNQYVGHCKPAHVQHPNPSLDQTDTNSGDQIGDNDLTGPSFSQPQSVPQPAHLDKGELDAHNFQLFLQDGVLGGSADNQLDPSNDHTPSSPPPILSHPPVQPQEPNTP
ncbi:hypothetical protein V8B97DRAFT_1914317 [Scleroderma yunnanense]